jgi:hypothetical protein
MFLTFRCRTNDRTIDRLFGAQSIKSKLKDHPTRTTHIHVRSYYKTNLKIEIDLAIIMFAMARSVDKL